MKKLRVILSLVAFVVAVGVTYSSNLLVKDELSVIDGYDYVSTASPQCVFYDDACDNAGGTDCTFGASGILRENSNETASCGNNLKMLP